MWMNEYDIDEAVDIANRYFPEIAPYAQYLRDWRDTVNDNSDGWAHARSLTRCADKISGYLGQLKVCAIEGRDPPSEDVLRKSLTPIKAAATKHHLPAPVLETNQPSPGFR